jgi:site-specific recombinase XerD
LIEYNELLTKTLASKSGSSNYSPTLYAMGAHYLFLNPNSGFAIDSKYLTIMMKKEMHKMGINEIKFTAYSVKHSAVTFLVNKGLKVEEIEQAMHYKQKNSTVMIFCLNILKLLKTFIRNNYFM